MELIGALSNPLITGKHLHMVELATLKRELALLDLTPDRHYDFLAVRVGLVNGNQRARTRREANAGARHPHSR